MVNGDKSEARVTRGPYDPYVGSKTREKRSEHGYRIVGTDTTSRAFRKLQLISSQIGDSPRLKALIDLIGLTRSNTRLSDISECLPTTTGGTLSHRYAARAGHQEAYSIGSPNFSTNCLISSDRSGKLVGGLEDYPVMFQEFYLMALWILENTPDSLNYSYTVFKTDPLDLAPLPSLSLEIPPVKIDDLPRLTGNPLAFVDNIKLERVRGVGSVRCFTLRDWHTAPELSRREIVRIIELTGRDIMRLGGQARLASDSGHDLFPETTLDVNEVSKAGLESYTDAMVNVVADEVLVAWSRVVHYHTDRVHMEASAIKLCRILGLILSRTIGNPLVREDPFVKRHRLFALPRYHRSEGSTADKLYSIMTNKVLHILSYFPELTP
jgi:hypothetical protein